MKKFVFAFLLITAGSLYAQKNKDKDQGNFQIVTGGTFAKAKVIPGTQKLGVAQVSINFKNTTKRAVYENQKSFNGFGKSVDAAMVGEITAYLITTDGELSKDDYQQVADSFYLYLTQKLNANGISAIEWNKIITTDYYKNEVEESTDITEEMKKKGQVWVPVNANNGATIYKYNPFATMNTGFAFGKIKKTARFCEDIDASAVFMHVTLDFADIVLEGEVSSKKKYTAYTETKINRYTLKSEVTPNVKVTPNAENSCYFWNKKMQAELLVLQKEVSANTEFATSTETDPQKIEQKSTFKKMFGGVSFSKKMTAVPVVIETTRAQYKAAAIQALKNYADEMIVYMKACKNN